MKTLLKALILVLVTTTIYGQSGLNVYAGLANATNKDALVTPEGRSHPGFMIGCDARLNADNMYFVVGGQYHKINFLAQSDKSYFSVDEKMTWVKLRVGLGYNIAHFTDKIILRAKTLGTINLISSYPELAEAPYSGIDYNSSTAGAVLGLGIDVYSITLDVEYEKGFFNAVNKIKGTEFDFLNITLGFIF